VKKFPVQSLLPLEFMQNSTLSFMASYLRTLIYYPYRKNVAKFGLTGAHLVSQIEANVKRQKDDTHRLSFSKDSHGLSLFVWLMPQISECHLARTEC
jgi:hypothetical protein